MGRVVYVENVVFVMNKETVKDFVRRISRTRHNKLTMADIDKYSDFYYRNENKLLEFLTDMPSYSLMLIMEKVRKRHMEILDFGKTLSQK